MKPSLATAVITADVRIIGKAKLTPKPADRHDGSRPRTVDANELDVIRPRLKHVDMLKDKYTFHDT